MDVQDQPFRIERSTAAPIPAQARHGRPRELFTFWLTTSTSFSAIVVGGLAVDLGLGLWQAVVCIALGAASFAVLGAVSSLGPRFGLPTMGIGERVFGHGANKVNAFIAWLLTLGWGRSDWSSGQSRCDRSSAITTRARRLTRPRQPASS